MFRTLARVSLLLACLVLANSLFAASPVPDDYTVAKQARKARKGWISLFNGRDLSGWEALDQGRWTVNGEGVLIGDGPSGHLFSPRQYTNFEFRAEIRVNAGGNSSVFLRAAKAEGVPAGYQAQAGNAGAEDQKTGSLCGLAKVTEQLVPDESWWIQHIVVIGNRIVIKVNDKVVVNYTDPQHTYHSGFLALQQSKEGSLVFYKNIMVKPLPLDERAAWKIALQDVPELDPKHKK